jgi:integrase/recombinase XerD
MIFSPSDGIFDTLTVTQKNYGTMKTRFCLRKDVQVDGKCPIYLYIGGNEKRINLKIYIVPQIWLCDKKRVKPINREMEDVNLLLDNIDAKLTNIKTVYRLSEIPLSAEQLAVEFLNKLSKVNFVAFFKAALEVERAKMTEGSFDRHHSVYKKLMAFNPYIPFNEINLLWFDKYRNHLKFKLKNQDTTISANMASLKKFLGIAQENGVKLVFDLKKLDVGDTKGNRVYLNEKELEKLFKFYRSEFINKSNQLILGYFLFSCMTGLRISNVQKLQRKDLLANDFSFVAAKSKKDKNIMLNQKAKEIIMTCDDLFLIKFSDQYLNEVLRKITNSLGITKHVSFHVARHTFATLFLKMGGKVEMLQLLLGHSAITETMVYVHIVQAEANKEIFLLDKLF